MKIELERSLDLPVAAARAWNFLERIEDVAACMPGTAITERVDDTHYKGVVRIRLGPATMNFAGEISILARDAATQTIHMSGTGMEAGGASAAEMELTVQVRQTGAESCQVAGKMTATLNGKAAAFGSRLMNTVAEQLIKQFYANLLKRMEVNVSEPQASAAVVGSQASASGPAISSHPEPTKLNALAFIWAVIKDLIAGLFSRKRLT